MDTSVSAHYDAAAADYHLQYERENLFTSEEYPANYFRLQLLVTRLATCGLKRVYEVGVGEGTPLAAIASMGHEVAGCDISQAMVETARQNFVRHKLSPDLIQWADIQDSTTLANQLAGGRYDAVIALGVLPHIQSEVNFLRNLRMLLAPGGRVFIEFRNKLFSLFTFNRYTREFILDDLLAGVSPDLKGVVAAELDRRLAVDQPPLRTDFRGAPGYDTLLSKFHNPFELTELFQRHGFRDTRLHWYHFHATPPILAGADPAAFRAQSMQLELDLADSWRGYFLCSAGVLEATVDA